ncbi:RIP metalloprotease RseP [Silanimonas sp.]|uniref:RIP metalloprotease RseP n=1 Tax=Silanimonas sp. TaxID=1929290 RepID=UPI0022CA7318|nr:RIP metalloprotease RseP [Silanimonas sp.]MCZ8114853.1 RIP metalloprotease RseP [Silanimonas sp.]
MSEILSSAFWLVVALGVLITFHEFGHYWVARRCGVKVLRFSVGFGRALWSRTDRDGIEWRIGLIPLGGYVSMLDEREGEVADEDRPRAFTSKPVGQRIAIVAAGPLANLVLAVGLLYVMFVVGKPDYVPVLAEPQALAAASGFEAGDRLLVVDGRDTPTWTDAQNALLGPMVDRRSIAIEVSDADGNLVQRELKLATLDPALEETAAFRALGFVPRRPVPPAVVGGLAPGSPAAAVLEVGDRIVSIDGAPVADFDDLLAALAAHPVDGPAPTLRMRIERDGKPLKRTLVPQRVTPEGAQAAWRLGVSAPDPRDALLQHGPLEALPEAVKATGQLANDTVGMLWRMVTGAASLQNLSGPITIAQVANTTAARGVAWFLYFLAMLSVSIAILNLLPIPVLDGGHLLVYLIELVQGRPLGDRVLVAGQYLGLVLLASLMGLALFNDVLRLVP